jgi:hypothetical protein
MAAFYRRQKQTFRLAPWCLAGVLIVVLCGCAGWKAKDDGFPKNDLSDTIRQARPSKNSVECSSPSEKGRQIERELNAL